MIKNFSLVYFFVLTVTFEGNVYSASLKSQIRAECNKYGAWSSVLYSVAIEESSLNPYAFNTNEYSRGLMQIRNVARREYFRLYGILYSREDMFNYKISIKVAHGLLIELYKIWNKNLYMTLASYNAGTTKVREEGVQDHDYVKNVLSRVNKGNVLLKGERND